MMSLRLFVTNIPQTHRILTYNPQNTDHADVDYSRHYVLLLVPVLKVKYASNLETLIYVTNHIGLHFQSLEVVCRGSETQLQVIENLN